MLDKTKTPMGGRCLRSWLERPLLSVTAINRRSSAVAALVEATIARVAANGSMLAMEYGGDVESMAQATFLTTVCAMVTVPLIATVLLV